MQIYKECHSESNSTIFGSLCSAIKSYVFFYIYFIKLQMSHLTQQKIYDVQIYSVFSVFCVINLNELM